MELLNISFYEYTLLENRDDYDIAINYGVQFLEPINHFAIKLHTVKFGLVKEFQQNLELSSITWDFILKLISETTGKKIKELQHYPLIKLCQQKESLIKDLGTLLSYENDLLGGDAGVKESNAAAGLFDKLGIVIQYNMLTCGNISLKKQVYEIPYFECFEYMLLVKRTQEYQKRLSDAYKPKAI
jgi:hypothetical protein